MKQNWKIMVLLLSISDVATIFALNIHVLYFVRMKQSWFGLGITWKNNTVFLELDLDT